MWVGLVDADRKFWREVAIFARTAVEPKILEWDRAGSFPRAVWEWLSKKALLGIGLTNTAGQGPRNLKRLALALDAFAYGSRDLGIVNSWGVHSAMVGAAISDAGTSFLKQRYLERLRAGKFVGAFALTEPSAGSHASGIQTTARRDKSGYVLVGSKSFVTNGPEADVFIIVARDGDRPGDSFSAFVVPRDAAGLMVGPPQEKSCIRTSQCCDVVLDKCRVPANHLLGTRGNAMESIVLPSLDRDRCIVWAGRLGRLRSILEDATSYAIKRVQFGKPLVRHQAVLFKLAEIKIRLETSEALLSTALDQLDEGRDVRQSAAIARFVLGEATKDSADAAMQIFGGYGFYPRNHVERYHRDAQLDGIGGGTAEMQRLIIGRQLLAAIDVNTAWMSAAVLPQGLAVASTPKASRRSASSHPTNSKLAKGTRRLSSPRTVRARVNGPQERRGGLAWRR